MTRDLLADLPSTAEGPRTAAVLGELAHRWPGPPGAADRQSLEALCRKVHLARQIDAAYAPGWRKLRSATPLPAAHWPLLVADLLAYASVCPDADEHQRGFALKCLNAGLAALDRAERQAAGVAHLPALRAWAQEILEDLAPAVES